MAELCKGTEENQKSHSSGSIKKDLVNMSVPHCLVPVHLVVSLKSAWKTPEKKVGGKARTNWSPPGQPGHRWDRL